MRAECQPGTNASIGPLLIKAGSTDASIFSEVFEVFYTVTDSSTGSGDCSAEGLTESGPFFVGSYDTNSGSYLTIAPSDYAVSTDSINCPIVETQCYYDAALTHGCADFNASHTMTLETENYAFFSPAPNGLVTIYMTA